MNVAERQKPAPGDLFLDHVAHFVPDLGAAARLLESLGFVPTPESAHRAQGAPAGTSNRCLMFGAGYIGILAPTMNTPNAERVRKHMARYDGVHLACWGTPDAAFEHARLAAQGFTPEPLVNLSREVEGGETELARHLCAPVAPAQPAGNHEVNHKVEISLEADDDALPQPAEPRHPPALDRADGRLDGA